MQVDRQPSPWPCVAMLASLLLLCLMAPRYWRSSESPVAANSTPGRPATTKGNVLVPFAWEQSGRWSLAPSAPRQEFDPLRLWASPTIEELVAARIGIRRVEDQSFRLPEFGLPVAPEMASSPLVETEPDALDPVLESTFERFGQILSDYSAYSASEALNFLAAKFVDFHREWTSQQVATSDSQPNPLTWKVVQRENRQALAPAGESRFEEPPASLAPEKSVSAFDRWCEPQTLFEQLRRLAHHPESAIWAQQTIAQLALLTNRGQLEGEDVQHLLAALSDSAHQAARMAETTGEDRLRVALLRAHWGLARRIDCWTTVHDIRVAHRGGDRLALHGPIESFVRVRPGHVHVVETPRASSLTADLERYERSRDPQLGRQLVRQQRALQASTDPLDRSLADSVERHYRNANIRIAITAELLNRLVAEDRSEMQSLRDRIAGTPIRGSSHTRSESRVRLEPASDRWQVTVEAEGQVDAHTLADGGAARLRSHSATDFAARKSVLVDPSGVHLQRAVVDATNRNRLVGVTTDFDWVPLLGSFARERAISEYRARRDRARSEIEFRVSNEAVEHLDRETAAAVERIEREIRERFTDRLAGGGVDLTPIEMVTTSDRVVGRFRVAGDHQLGSHTPRPRALSDSLASMQIHETAFTNAAVVLSLDGGRFTGTELRDKIRESFPRMESGGELPRHDVVFRFAANDAVQFRISDGRLDLALALAEVEQGGRTMRNIVVHAYYVPMVNGLEAELRRNGALGIEGRLSSSQRARLQNVFDSVLPPDRTLPVVRLENPNDPRLAGLMITQLVLEDGWLGLAVGPAMIDRTAERSRSLR